MIGDPLPVRFNGKTLVEPTGQEPIINGGMMILGSDVEEHDPFGVVA